MFIFMLLEEELEVLWFNELICTFIMANISRCFLGQKILLVSMTPAFSEEQLGHAFFHLLII